MPEHFLTALDCCIYQSWPAKRQKRSPKSDYKIQYEEQDISNRNKPDIQKQERASRATASANIRPGQGNCRMGITNRPRHAA